MREIEKGDAGGTGLQHDWPNGRERLDYEGLTTSMIYGGSGPRERDANIPMPEVDGGDIWLEKAEGDRRYPLTFKTKGAGRPYSLVPLYKIMDERYSVYLKSAAKA